MTWKLKTGGPFGGVEIESEDVPQPKYVYRDRPLTRSELEKAGEVAKDLIKLRDIRLAMKWWYGGPILTRSEGRQTHVLLRGRHAGWICVKKKPDHTFEMYLKMADTFDDALEAIVAAHKREHPETLDPSKD